MIADNTQSAVVFGFTSNHTGAVASVVMDLMQVSGTAIHEFVFLHDDKLDQSDAAILGALCRARFVHYDAARHMKIAAHSKAVRSFTSMVFSKFECFRLLDSYDTVTWLDYDIVVLKDIAELFVPCESGMKIIRSGSAVRAQFLSDIEGYDMSVEGVSAGTFALDRNLRQAHDILEFCYSAAAKYQKVLSLPDQAIFDLAIQEFSLSPLYLDGPTYVPHPTSYQSHAKILHAYGGPKFWNGLHNAQWESNYARWLALGGTPITETPRVSSNRLVHLVKKWLP